MAANEDVCGEGGSTNFFSKREGQQQRPEEEELLVELEQERVAEAGGPIQTTSP